MNKLKYLLFLVFYFNSIYTQNYHEDLSFTQKDSYKNIKIGLVLSGGGARGFSQIGALKILEKYNIKPNLIVGNSIGAIIGGLYCSGYSATQLESIAINTNWDELLSLSEETKRTELFLDQKQAREKGFLIIRFDGLIPIIPSSISSGQNVLNYLNQLVLQALYHPEPSFDQLKIPFRAVAADLYTGKRYVFDKGSLVEALRASSGIPFLFTPLEKDSLYLIDGGVVSNIPVDIAKKENCDIIIVVNSTSEIDKLPDNSAPWEIADQLMTIMMQQSNNFQLSFADIVIKPELGKHLASDFTNIQKLIDAGASSTLQKIDTLLSLIKLKKHTDKKIAENLYNIVEVVFKGDELPDEIKSQIREKVLFREFTKTTLLDLIKSITANLNYENISIEFQNHSSGYVVVIGFEFPIKIKNVRILGVTKLNEDEIEQIKSDLINKNYNSENLNSTLENISSKYRTKGYSLARAKLYSFDKITGELQIIVEEGYVSKLYFNGLTRTAEYVLRREFPLQPGEIFELKKVQKGITNIKSLDLFEYVLLEIENDPSGGNVIAVRVKERYTDILRLGVGANNERGFLSNLDIRDLNFRGHGEELGLSLTFGSRDKEYVLDYRVRRIFHTYFTFNAAIFYKLKDIFTYRNDPNTSEKYWKRVEDGEYRQMRYGGLIGFGTQMERLGNIIFEYRYEKHRVNELITGGYVPGQFPLAIFKVSTMIDTKNSATFPTLGMFLSIAYESALKNLGSNVSFTKLSINYENYISIFSNHTFGVKLFFGAADATLPLTEQFSIGGINSFLGLRQYDSRGRQTLQLSGEYRFRLPFKIIYPTYTSFKYQLGMISSVPQELKLIDMRHGFGFQIGIDSPIGAVNAAIGRSFFLPTKVGKPIYIGPWLIYFSIGFDVN